MLQISGIDHLNLEVKSLEESIQFYKEVFNMKVIEREDRGTYGEYALLSAKGIVALALYENKKLKIQGINHIGFHVRNFDKASEVHAKYGDPRYPEVIEYENSKSFYLKDPSGHGIELSCRFAGGH